MTPGRPAEIAAISSTVDMVLVAVIVVLLVLAALLALAETGLVRTSKAKALALKDRGARGAGVLSRLVERPQRFLNAVILLVLVCQLVVATLVGMLADQWFGGVGVALGTVFEIVVIFVLGEAVPKNWAVRHPEQAALFSAPFVAVLVGFWPIRVITSGLIALADLILGTRGEAHQPDVSESELLALADVAEAEDVIEHQERKLIHSIIGFGDTVVREVMVPRTDMHVVDREATVNQALDQAMEAGYSRLPVVDNHIDDVVGILYAKDLMRAARAGGGDGPVEGRWREARFVPETMRTAALMRQMQDGKFHMAVAVDEYGGTAGLVTLEDLIEELVGEIVDEYDVEEPPIVLRGDGEVSVAGRMVIDDVNDEFGTHLPTGAWDTIGGLVLDRLGRVPREGESVDVGGIDLVAARVRGRRIERVRFSVPPAPEPEDEP